MKIFLQLTNKLITYTLLKWLPLSMSFSVISSKEHRVLYSEFFWAYQYMYLICDWLELKGIYHGSGPCQEFPEIRKSRLVWNVFPSLALSLYTNLILKNSGSLFWCPNQCNSTKICLSMTLTPASNSKLC